MTGGLSEWTTGGVTDLCLSMLISEPVAGYSFSHGLRGGDALLVSAQQMTHY